MRRFDTPRSMGATRATLRPSAILRHSPSPGIRSHELGFTQDMAFHRRQELGLGSAGLQLQEEVKRVELEEVAVRLARGWGRAAEADLAEVVGALRYAVGQGRLRGNALAQLPRLGRQVEEYPVG